MKKLFTVLLLSAVLLDLALPLAAFAAQGPQECCKVRSSITLDGVTAAGDQIVGKVLGTDSCDIGAVTLVSAKWGMFCTISTIMTITDWIFVIMIVGSVLLVIMGAVSLMTAAGDPTKVTEGRNYILYAAIGLLVAFVARAIPSIVKAMLGY